jgi:hypothetical protein
MLKTQEPNNTGSRNSSPSVQQVRVQSNSKIPSYKVELPSRGVFYEGKSSIKVKPFSVKQIKQLVAASKTKDDSERESIVAETIAESVEDFDVYDLTVDDYEFLLYWLRLNSYKKAPYYVMWSYTQGDGTEKPIRSTVNMSDIKVIECDPAKRPVNKDLQYTTVRDKIQLVKLVEESDIYVASYASVLNSRDESGRIITIIDKINKLGVYPAEIIMDIKEHLDRFRHGVEEYILVEDIEVSGFEPRKLKLELQLADFFP